MLLLASPVQALTRYVNVATGVDGGSCTNSSSPCKTITYAMGQASAGDPGDLVQVAPGTYNLAAGEVFPIVIKSGTQLVSSGTAENTAIDASGDTVRLGILSIASNSSSAALIRGFKFNFGLYVAGQGGSSAGGAIRVVSATAQVTLDRNYFFNNQARGYNADNTFGMAGGAARGGALYVHSSAVAVTNNVFASNGAHGGDGFSHAGSPLTANEYGGSAEGGAIYFSGTGRITNNTFFADIALGGSGGVGSNGMAHGGGGLGGAITAPETPAPSIDNNIFQNNFARSGNGGGSPDPTGAAALMASLAPSINKNLFHENRVNGALSNTDSFGTGPVFGDARFSNAMNANFRLRPESIAKSAGTATGAPAVDFDGVVRPNPPSIGAFEPSVLPPVAESDFNGDLRSDLMWRNSSTGQIYLMTMNGFLRSSEGFVYTEPDTAWLIVGDADFDGNGVSDLLWRNSSTGQVSVLLFNGAGVPYRVISVTSNPDPAWKIVHTPDLNGDGRADLLWWNTSTGAVFAMVSLPNSFPFVFDSGGTVYSEPNTAWRIAAVGDFSGTGRQNQLLWRNSDTGQVFLMTVSVAGGVYSQSGGMIYQEPNTAWKIIAAADFDGDGRSDILWRNDVTGRVYMMLMNGGAIASERQIHEEPNTAWKVVATGDYNGDGKADILWRNDITGQVYMMLMDGLAIASQAMIYQEPNIAWKVLGPWEYSK